MLITGYENHPLVDGSTLLTDPAFWAVHALMVGATGLDDPRRDFGVDTEDAEELDERLFDPDHWPVFTVPLHSGAALHVIYRNLADDMGLDYVLSGPAWPHDLWLAAVEGCFVGPGLSWHELITTAHQAPTSAPTSTADSSRRLLLLLPTLGDADLPDSAVPALTAALTHTTASPAPQHVAETLLRKNHAYWQPAHWTKLANGALVCDEYHSRRCPRHPRAFTPEQALAITQALTGT
ncbi:hypothetical protein [Actinomadura sp. 6K520]|uniref:hypothetical protein n=1 Tax=Actinomadura sp. 6K520 TaxID=2530364 RepID=UPI001042A623|nr:hypothetical protein [Actinomadura sp. 6K520]TDE35695.1 hypothetical protein E1289_07435 [Actinomadura sp. 6K520]